MSSTQITIILKIFKDFFACDIVLDANHHYPGNIQRFFLLQIVLAANHHYPENIQRLFLLQIVLAANHHYLEVIQRLFWLQNCLSRRSSLSWKHSKNFSPAKMSSTQITIILKIFKDFFACKTFLAANYLCLENIQRLFWLQNCLSRKSSLSWKHSKTFLTAKLSQPQIIFILKTFKDLFACKIVLDANHHYPENFQRLFRLQYCLGRKSSFSWKYSKFFWPAKSS